MTAPGEVDLEVLLEDLAHIKQRLWKAEVKQEVTINFLRATLPMEDVELFEAYLYDSLSDDHFEIPAEAKFTMAMLHAIFKKVRDYDDRQAVQNFLKAELCKEDPLNAEGGFHK